MKIGGQSEQIGERPPLGAQVAVLCAVHDVGLQEGFEGKIQRKAVLIFESEHRNTKGVRFTLNKMVTASSNEKATMTKIFSALVGRAPTAEEQKEGFDDALMVGKSCFVNLGAPSKEGGWPNIEAFMPLPKGMSALVPEGDYSEDAELPKFVQTMLANRVSSPRPATTTQPAPAVSGEAPTSRPPF